MPRKLYIKTYGCQMNVYDSKRMADILSPLGYEATSTPDDADLAILNTCHIREKAEQKVYSDLGRLKIKMDAQPSDQKMTIAVGGCVGQAEGAEIIKNAPYVSMVFGPQSYHQLPEMIAKIHRQKDEALQKQAMVADDCGETSKKKKRKQKNPGIVMTDFPADSKFDFLPQQEKTDTCAFIAIQEGCDKFCHFCVVPYTRGAEYSRPVNEIVAEAKRLAMLGAREVMLLGQNVNAYHGEGPNGKTWSLADLIRAVADVDGIDRIRYTTSHPKDMTGDLIKAHGDVEKLMPFLHLPIQSGSNKMLQAMNRKHNVDMYLESIDKLREVREDMAFSSDFIVGYPGETDADHNDTLKIVERVFYAQCYSFKYSKRPGTPAAALDLQVDESVKSDRLAELQALLIQQQTAFNKSKEGSIQKVLFDRTGKVPGQIIGKTPYMQSVPLVAPTRLLGQLVDVKIINGYPASLQGEIITVESDPAFLESDAA